MFTHALTCTLGSTCHVLFGRLSPAGEPHFRVPESKQQQERRIRGERTVRQAGPLAEWLQAPVALGRWRKAGEGRGVISWPWAGCWAGAGVITEALGHSRLGQG